jgi:hypothetical protein
MKLVSDRYEQTMSLLILSEEEPNCSKNNEKENESAALDEYINSGHFSKR